MARRVRMSWEGSHSAMVLVLPWPARIKQNYLVSFRLAVLYIVFLKALKRFADVVRCELLFPESNYMFPIPSVWERVFIDQLLNPPIDVYNQLLEQHFDSFPKDPDLHYLQLLILDLFDAGPAFDIPKETLNVYLCYSLYGFSLIKIAVSNVGITQLGNFV